MKPLRVEASLVSRVVMPVEGSIHLDGLLMAAVARRDALPPLMTQGDVLTAKPLEIPIARSECCRYYLASTSFGEVRARETRYIQRRFPLQEAIAMGGASLKRVATNAGACKAFRIPVEAVHVPQLTWWAVGDAEEVRELLGWVTRVGRRRAVGEGEVRDWTVVELDDVWPGFPVLTEDGRPLRNLPLEHAGIGEHTPRFARLVPPYWSRVDEEACACP